MPRKRPSDRAAPLYLLKVEYDKRGNGIWHFLVTHSFGDSEWDQIASLDRPGAVLPTWKALPVGVDRLKKCPDLFVFWRKYFVAAESAVAVLRPLLGNSVEFLPLRIVAECEEMGDLPATMLSEEYPPVYLIHPLRHVGLAPGARVSYCPGTTIVTEVQRYAFHRAEIAKQHLFWLEGEWKYIVSEKFREVVEQEGLRGVKFEKIAYDLVEGSS